MCAGSPPATLFTGYAANTPALLLRRRSKAPDSHAPLGHRTFLHPVAVSAATFDGRIGSWSSAPPFYPLILSSTLPGFGAQPLALLADVAQTQALLASLRDGFHAQSPGVG